MYVCMCCYHTRTHTHMVQDLILEREALEDKEVWKQPVGVCLSLCVCVYVWEGERERSKCMHECACKCICMCVYVRFSVCVFVLCGVSVCTLCSECVYGYKTYTCTYTHIHTH